MDETVACVGAGAVGRAWAVRFAMSGCRVNLFDISETMTAQSVEAISRSAEDLEAAGRIENADDVRRRIAPFSELEPALDRVSYVQENVTEDVDVKRDVFRDLDRLTTEHVILASSTSEITGSKIFAELRGRGRCVIAHPLNPPYLIPLVELCPSPWTTREALESARRFLIGVGQKPIVVRKEISGFVANRLQLAVLGEALHLVGEGYCDAEDIETAVKDGLALRWVIVGPFETGHLNADAGYRSYIDAQGATHRKIIADLEVDYDWGDDLIDRLHEILTRATPASKVPERQAWRDRRLMALTKHLEECEQG
jgi:3-hydroxyacyl-CoA dehydrogenase